MNRGDVVYVDWPFSDRQGSKVRPAIVVQADFLNTRIADTILVLVSRTSRAPGQTEVLLDPAIETNSGLRYVSVASCTNFLTVDQALVLRKIGELSNLAMQQIDQALQLVLGLP
jgi:mRNA-degrading endonuclease toxin of MazEF toxin-antitoxin module